MNERFTQLVVLKSLVDKVLFQIHDSNFAGHPGRDRSLSQAKRSYFWPSMRKDIFSHCASCHSCAAYRLSPSYQSPSPPYPILSRWDSISIDLLKLPLTQNGFQYLFVCVDSFSRFTIFVPLKNKTLSSIAKALIDHVICSYGSPLFFLSDNGSEFNNSLLQSICQDFHIKNCNIIPYSPSSNGKVERCNKRILNILRNIMGCQSNSSSSPSTECSTTHSSYRQKLRSFSKS